MSYLLKCMDQLRKCSVYELKFRKSKLVLLKSYNRSDGGSLEKVRGKKNPLLGLAEKRTFSLKNIVLS